MKDSLPASSVSIVTDSLQSLDALMDAILQPLIGKTAAMVFFRNLFIIFSVN